ncbi:hypothetical protein ACFUJR_37675 [Streptomyces sp. NPDC057271]|uniref:hypothetical protein n=1 Tax=unclassified Streptomyces TaxID=2593676 RepID=UPI003643022F
MAQSLETALVTGLVVFCGAVGVISLVALLLVLLQLAAATAGAIAAAGIGATVSIPLARRKGK